MASGDSVGSGHGSEEYFTHECDICKQDGLRKQAAIFCPDCEEYLCRKCQNWHKKSTASKTHEVQLVSERKSSPYKARPMVTSMKNWCSCNQRKEVSEFCVDHHELACSVCMKIKHRSCKKATIDQMISEKSVVPAFNEISSKINELLDKASDLQSDHATCMRKLEEVEQSCRREIKSFRTLLSDWLIKLEQDALLDLHKRIEEQKNLLEEGHDSLDSAVQLLNIDKQLLEDTTKTQSERQMFITCNRVQKSLHHYGASIEYIESKLVVPRTEFERNEKLSQMEQEINCLGEIKTQNEVQETVKKASFLEAVCKGTETVCVKDDSDSFSPLISGISFLNNGELIIADYNNWFLKKFDTTLTVKDSVKCIRPWDIAVFDDQKVLVSFPGANMLQYFIVEPKLQAGRSISVSGNYSCWGVAVTSDRIYVSQWRSGSSGVLILDSNGKELNNITTCQTNIKLRRLFYVTLNRSGNKLYVSDCDTNQLTCMAAEGKPIFTYSDPDLKCPRGIVVDEDDNILLCGESSNNIHVIKSDGTKHKVLLSSTDGIKSPCGMAYCLSSRKLAIGGYDVAHISIFTLQ